MRLPPYVGQLSNSILFAGSASSGYWVGGGSAQAEAEVQGWVVAGVFPLLWP